MITYDLNEKPLFPSQRDWEQIQRGLFLAARAHVENHPQRWIFVDHDFKLRHKDTKYAIVRRISDDRCGIQIQTDSGDNLTDYIEWDSKLLKDDGSPPRVPPHEFAARDLYYYVDILEQKIKQRIEDMKFYRKLHDAQEAIRTLEKDL